MLKFLSFLKGEQRAEIKDAHQIYRKVMKQSRKTSFYGPKLFADSYDGRMEVLCMHLSIILHALRQFEANGERLSQAIYDVMVDDFDTALREEGLSDTGVARRIKPLAKMFFSRAKAYGDVLESNEDKQTKLGKLLQNYILQSYGKDDTSETTEHVKIAIYAEKFSKGLVNADLGNTAQASFTFPNLS